MASSAASAWPEASVEFSERREAASGHRGFQDTPPEPHLVELLGLQPVLAGRLLPALHRLLLFHLLQLLVQPAQNQWIRTGRFWTVAGGDQLVSGEPASSLEHLCDRQLPLFSGHRCGRL